MGVQLSTEVRSIIHSTSSEQVAPEDGEDEADVKEDVGVQLCFDDFMRLLQRDSTSSRSLHESGDS